MTNRIFSELLISLVESWPCLWDKSSKTYRDLQMRCDAWTEICSILRPEYNTWPTTDRDSYVKTIMKKWSVIRNTWKKNRKRDKKKQEAFRYEEQLKFLQKNLRAKKEEGDSKIITIEDSTVDGVSSTTDEKKFIVEQQEHTSESDEEDAHCAFIKSLQPSLKRLNDREVLEFQIGVIKLLRSIRRRSKCRSRTVAYYKYVASNVAIEDKEH